MAELTQQEIEILLNLLHNVQLQGTMENIRKTMLMMEGLEVKLLTLQEGAPSNPLPVALKEL